MFAGGHYEGGGFRALREGWGGGGAQLSPHTPSESFGDFLGSKPQDMWGLRDSLFSLSSILVAS